MDTTVAVTRPLEEIIGPDLAYFVRGFVSSARAQERAKENATEEDVRIAGVVAGRQWLVALTDGVTLFDMGPVDPRYARLDWERYPGLPDPDEASVRYAREQIQKAAKARRAAADPPCMPSERVLALRRQIQRQLTLGGW